MSVSHSNIRTVLNFVFFFTFYTEFGSKLMCSMTQYNRLQVGLGFTDISYLVCFENVSVKCKSESFWDIVNER